MAEKISRPPNVIDMIAAGMAPTEARALEGIVGRAADPDGKDADFWWYEVARRSEDSWVNPCEPAADYNEWFSRHAPAESAEAA